MGWQDYLDSNARLHFLVTRLVTTVLIFVGLAGALMAFLDATIGAAYYDLMDALTCLGIAAFALFYRVVGPPVYQLFIDAFKGPSK